MNIALGLLDLTHTTDQVTDQHTLVELADRHGYRITTVLTLDAHTYMPTSLIIDTAARTRATAIIAPDIAHFGAAPAALALHHRLITPAGITEQTSGWSPYR